MRYRTPHDDYSPLVRRFALNEHGRDLIVGDIHGCFDKLQVRLDADLPGSRDTQRDLPDVRT